MDEKQAKIEELRKLIGEVGAEIQPKLNPLPYRSRRNAFAHLYGAINDILGCTYSEANFDDVVKLLEAIRNEPNIEYEELEKLFEDKK